MWHEPELGGTILVCDDEPLFGTSLRRLIRSHAPQLRVVLAVDGDGPQLARALPSVDLIVLDLFQPVPAAEQLRALRALPATAHAPLVVVSAVGAVGPEHEEVCRQACTVMQKPLGVEFVRFLLELLQQAAA